VNKNKNSLLKITLQSLAGKLEIICGLYNNPDQKYPGIHFFEKQPDFVN